MECQVEELFLRSMILISLGRYLDSAMRHDVVDGPIGVGEGGSTRSYRCRW